MSCNSSFIGIYKDGSDNPLIGICLGITGDGLDLKYYEANGGQEFIFGSGDILTCCSGSFEQSIRGLSCNSALIGVFVDVDGNPLFAKFEGIKGGIAILTYYSADTGDVFVGTVYYCCSGGGGVGGYTIVSINFASSPYTVIPTTSTTLYQVDCTGGNIIMNFPTAIGSTAIWGVKKIDSSLNTITLEPFGAQTIDGNANQTILFQNTQVDIYSDNANLFIK